MIEFTEFTEKLNSSELVSKAWDEIDKDQANAGLLIDTISNEFKYWQPPKPLVVVPQFFADWFENQLKNNESKKFDGNDIFRIIQDVIKVSNDESTWEDYGITDEIAKFAEDNEELFLNLIVNCSFKVGYTVEKEPKFSLVNKITGEYLVLPAIEYRIKNENIFDHSTHRKKDDLPEWKPEMYQFTEVEITSMETGSYEQIEVEP